MKDPIATHDFSDGGVEAAILFFKRTRDELRMLRKVRIGAN